MNEEIELKPGQTLSIVWEGKQKTPFGDQIGVSKYNITYDELLSKLDQTRKKGSRKSKNPGTKFSRMVCLAARAVESGKWSTGAEIDVDKIIFNLKEKFVTLSPQECDNLTEKAKEGLKSIYLKIFEANPKSARYIRDMLKASRVIRHEPV